MEYRCVDTDSGLRSVLAEISDEPRVALDTEFHRERTYRPQTALVQIAWSDGLALIDPLAVDLKPLAGLFEQGPLVIAHAPDQDLEVLECCCGAVPERLFDTQIAAGFLGLGVPSLAALHKAELGLTLPKSDRMADWLARPLKRSQLDYAASDVRHLLEIHDRLSTRLAELGRSSWAEAEFALLLEGARSVRDPERAWSNLKNLRQLNRRDLPIARSLAMWREQRASDVNRPARHVLSDMAVVSIAAAAPRTPAELSKIRGVDQGIANSRIAPGILQAVRDGANSTWQPPRALQRNSAETERRRQAAALVRAWVGQFARENMIHPPLLATTADIEALLRGDPDARLSQGWRAELIAAPIRRLVQGEVAVAFDGDSLVIEERSRRPAT